MAHRFKTTKLAIACPENIQAIANGSTFDEDTVHPALDSTECNTTFTTL